MESESEEVWSGIVRRLRSREAEHVTAIFEHLRDVEPDHLEEEKAREYADALRAAVAAALDYCFTAIEHRGDDPGPRPPTALEQARYAVREGVSLKVVLRRCHEIERVLRRIVTEESGDIPAGMLSSLQGSAESSAAHLTLSIADEYEQERRQAEGSVESRRGRIVARLLAGVVHLYAEDPEAAAYGYPRAWNGGKVDHTVWGWQYYYTG